MRGWVLCCILVLLCDSAHSSGAKLQSCTHKHVSVDGRIMMTTIACKMKNTGSGMFSAPENSFQVYVTGRLEGVDKINEPVAITNGEGAWGNFQTTTEVNTFKGLYVSTPTVPERIVRPAPNMQTNSVQTNTQFGGVITDTTLTGSTSGSCPTETSSWMLNGNYRAVTCRASLFYRRTTATLAY